MMSKFRDVIPLRRPIEHSPDRWGLYSFKEERWLAGHFRTQRQAIGAASSILKDGSVV